MWYIVTEFMAYATKEHIHGLGNIIAVNYVLAFYFQAILVVFDLLFNNKFIAFQVSFKFSLLQAIVFEKHSLLSFLFKLLTLFRSCL